MPNSFDKANGIKNRYGYRLITPFITPYCIENLKGCNDSLVWEMYLYLAGNINRESGFTSIATRENLRLGLRLEKDTFVEIEDVLLDRELIEQYFVVHKRKVEGFGPQDVNDFESNMVYYLPMAHKWYQRVYEPIVNRISEDYDRV